MSESLPVAPHFNVCLQMLALATKYARCFDRLDDQSLSTPEESGRIVQQIKAVRLLAEEATAVAKVSVALPMSLLDHTDRTVKSRLSQLQVVTTAAAENLERAVEESDPASFASLDMRLRHIDTARNLLATASADLIACAERVAAEMERYRSTYSMPEARHPLTAEQFQVLRLAAQGAVSVDEEGQPWVGLDKTAVRASALRALDRQGLVASEASAAWVGDVHVLPTPMGMLVLAASLGRPKQGVGDARSAPPAARASAQAGPRR
ncbi:hypothetical protein ACIQUV_00900 [Streptomyces globosus]|uniref:hypothetical protein n=1 Tax=Streptomyces globosus TaxID=68209 RepID=UPI0038017B97